MTELESKSAETCCAWRQSLNSIHAMVWGSVCLIAITLALLDMKLHGTGVWDQWTASSELLKPKYSEAVYLDDLFRTKANTWSNLVYIVVGFYAFGFARSDARARGTSAGYLVNTPAMSWLFGIGCCFLGIGSGLFHASLTRWGQWIDVVSMYAPLIALIAINIGRICPRIGRSIPSWPVLVVGTVVAEIVFFVLKWSMSSVVVLTSLVVALTGFMIVDTIASFRARNLAWFFSAIMTLVLATAFRTADVAGRFTGADSIQGHAIWHLLTGISLACLYRYQRGQQEPGILE